MGKTSGKSPARKQLWQSGGNLGTNKHEKNKKEGTTENKQEHQEDVDQLKGTHGAGKNEVYPSVGDNPKQNIQATRDQKGWPFTKYPPCQPHQQEEDKESKYENEGKTWQKMMFGRK